MGCKYFKTLWNWLDIVILCIAAVCISFDVYRAWAVQVKLKALASQKLDYANFEFLAYWDTQFSNMVAITLFFSWIKARSNL